MFKMEKNNEKIGAYLNKLIIAKYEKIRRFCIAYIKLSGLDWKDDSVIAKMQNRMSQIIQGKKAIQTYDLPIFCELLGVSCEEILSAGKHYVPISGHVTNYEIAFSKDRAAWEAYINRADKLILNPDEYNKTVIDYALEFKNYEFLKYLMENEYIWFIDDGARDRRDWSYGFCVGTSIERRNILRQDTFGIGLYHSEELGLRQKMIALAMENNDFEMLTSLRAREVPELYQACDYLSLQNRCKDYYNENVIEEIASSSDKILGYFSESFVIEDCLGYEHSFIYPYMSKLLEVLIISKNKYAEAVLRRVIKHNKGVFKKLNEMIDEAFELLKYPFSYENNIKMPLEYVIQNTMATYQFDPDDSLLFYSFTRGKKEHPRFCSNVVCVKAQSDNLLISSLIDELNTTYNAVRNIQPDTSKY